MIIDRNVSALVTKLSQENIISMTGVNTNALFEGGVVYNSPELQIVQGDFTQPGLLGNNAPDAIAMFSMAPGPVEGNWPDFSAAARNYLRPGARIYLAIWGEENLTTFQR